MHNTRPLPPFARLGLITAAGLLAAGCSVLEEEKVDYKSARQINSLEVPPDLSQINRDGRFQVPGSVVTASGFQTAQPTAQVGQGTAVSRVGDVRIERAGDQRWLVVDRPADQLWGPVKDFWQENGFLLKVEQQSLGILETDWAENRAKLPQDIIRRTLGRVFETLYSTGEYDKFRTRVERNAAGGTDIFISHRGMEEVFTSASRDQTVWQPRQADPALENEFLRRLMLKLGATDAQAQAALVATAPAQVQAQARVTTVNGQMVMQLNDSFDLAWRRVGLALDRSGFTVEDRNRAQGIYFVRYVADTPSKEQPGFFSRLFGGQRPGAAPVSYRVLVRAAGDNLSNVSVLDAQGQADASPTAQRIVQLLAEDLK